MILWVVIFCVQKAVYLREQTSSLKSICRDIRITSSSPRTMGEGDVLGAVLSKTGEGTFGAKTMHPGGGGGGGHPVLELCIWGGGNVRS